MTILRRFSCHGSAAVLARVGGRLPREPGAFSTSSDARAFEQSDRAAGWMEGWQDLLHKGDAGTAARTL